MNEQQRKRAQEVLRNSTEIEAAGKALALLQELVDAPEPEPVAWAYEIPVAGGYQTRFSEVKPTNILELNKRPLFAEHHAPCVPAMRSTNQWESSRIADYNRGWNECRKAMLEAAPPAPSVPDVELQAAFDRGLKAGNEQKDAQQVEIHRLHGLLAGAPPAPSVPDGWRPFLTDVITAAGLLQHGKRDKGLAGRIGKFAFGAMPAAPTPAEPPADVARDAARYRWLRTHGLQRAWVSLGTDFEGDNFASFRCEFNLPEPPNLPYEDDEGLQWADKDFDAAIDAAIEREILGGGE